MIHIVLIVLLDTIISERASERSFPHDLSAYDAIVYEE
jgi:hypothetical protein